MGLAVQNNNPGNVKPRRDGTLWHGQTDINKGFAVFDTDADGIRAMAHTITHKMKLGNNTITKLIIAYDTNDPAYISHVSNESGHDANEVLPLNREVLFDLINAMVTFEDYTNQVSEEDINDGIDLAEQDQEQAGKDLYTGTVPQQTNTQPTTQPKPTATTEASLFDFKLPALPASLTAAGIDWWEIGIVAAVALVFFRTRSNYN